MGRGMKEVGREKQGVLSTNYFHAGSALFSTVIDIYLFILKYRQTESFLA
jgi:hypothetical protein